MAVAVSRVLCGVGRRVATPGVTLTVNDHVVGCGFTGVTDPVDGTTGNQLGQNRQVRCDRHPFGYLLHGVLFHLVGRSQRGGGELRITQGCEGLLGAGHENRGCGKEERHGG